MSQKVKYEFKICHQKPERSFFYKGNQFPVCARCTGIYAGYIFIPIFLFFPINLLTSIVLLIPAILDGTTQAYCNRESNNILRVITGFMFGAGLIGFATLIGKGIGFFILNIIN